MISITLQGTDLTDLISKASHLVDSFSNQGENLDTSKKLVGPPGFEPGNHVKETTANQAKNLAVKSPQVSLKRAPGRPPKNKLKTLKAKKLLAEIQTAKEEIEAPKPPAFTAPAEVAYEAPESPVTREELQQALQRILNTKGINKVLKIMSFAGPGITHLRDVTEDKYSELMAMAQAEETL